MTQQVINVGAFANDATGDPLQTCFNKTNANFTELYVLNAPFVRTAAEIAASVTPVNFGYPPLTVERYGNNISPGTTDMTAAVNAAVKVAIAAGGGVVQYLASTYLVGSAGVFVTYNSGNITHQGVSREATTIINGSTNQPAISIGNGITTYFGGGIRQMLFTQRSGVTAVAGNCAFNWNLAGQFTIADVFVTNSQGAPFRGAFFTNASQFVIRNLQVQGCLSDGVTHIGAPDVYATDCRSDANGGAGWVLNATQGSYFKGCTAFGNTTSGWFMVSGSPATAPNKDNFFVSCVGDTSGSHNWNIGDSLDSVWIGCWGATQLSTAVNTFATGFVIYTVNCNQCYFDSCISENNNSHGFQVLDTGASAPTNISFTNCSFGSTAGGAHGNGQSGSGYGLTLNGAANRIRLNGGIFTGNASGSFQNQSSGADIVVTGTPVGYVSVNQGAGVIATTASSVVITHGLGFTPNLANILLSPTSSLAASGVTSFWASTPTATQFTVNLNAAAAGASFNFVWRASFSGS